MPAISLPDPSRHAQQRDRHRLRIASAVNRPLRNGRPLVQRVRSEDAGVPAMGWKHGDRRRGNCKRRGRHTVKAEGQASSTRGTIAGILDVGEITVPLVIAAILVGRAIKGGGGVIGFPLIAGLLSAVAGTPDLGKEFIGSGQGGSRRNGRCYCSGVASHRWHSASPGSPGSR